MRRFLAWVYRVQFSLPSFLLPSVLLFACNLSAVIVPRIQGDVPTVSFPALDAVSMIVSSLTAILALLSHFNSDRILCNEVRKRDESAVVAKNVASYTCINRGTVDLILSLTSPVLSIINVEYQWLTCLVLVAGYWFLSSIPVTHFLDPLLLSKWSFYEAEIENHGMVIIVMPKDKPAKPGVADVVKLRSDYYVCV